MSRYFFVCVAALSVSAAAAADYAPLQKAPPVEAFSWAGPYAGVFVGGGSGKSTATETTTTADDPSMCAPAGTAGVPAGMFWCNVNNKPNYSPTPTPSYNKIGDSWNMTNGAITAGLTLGYNWQFGDYVVGAEVDAAYLGLRGTSGFSPASIDDTKLHVAATTLSTARVRVGYAIDRFLLFTTAGVAAANFNAWVQDADTPIGIRTTPTTTQFGGVFGAGVEYAMTEHVILKADFLSALFIQSRTEGYTNLTCYPGIDSSVCDPAAAAYWKTGRLSDPQGAMGAWNVKHTLNIGRIGMNYKF